MKLIYQNIFNTSYGRRHRPVTNGAQGASLPPENFLSPLEKCVVNVVDQQQGRPLADAAALGPAPWCLGNCSFSPYSPGAGEAVEAAYLIASKQCPRSNKRLISSVIERAHVLMPGRYICAPPCLTLYGWNLVVSNAS